MIDYPFLYRSALISMVRDLLDRASVEGLPQDHAHYLSFKTDAPGVGLSPALREVYPDTMTIVLQHQFWDLSTDDDGFSVTLRFGGRPESLYVPWSALTSFVDPVAEFGFELPATDRAADGVGDGPLSAADTAPESVRSDGDSGEGESGELETDQSESEETSEESSAEPAEVVSLDRFRESRRPKRS